MIKYTMSFFIGFLLALILKNVQNEAMMESLKKNPELCPPCCTQSIK